MSSLDAIVDLQILNSQLDGEYGSTGDESCSIWRFIGAYKRQIKSSRS